LRKVFTPHDYQLDIRAHQLTLRRGATWAGMGTGKTAATLTALRDLQLVDPKPALVLAPLRVAQSTWPDECQKWEHLSDMEVQPVTGDVNQRRRALRNSNAGVFTTNYENLPWLCETLGDRWPFETVIADEQTRLKSFRTRQGGARAKALGRIAFKHVERFHGLTGTPAPNGVKDLWGPAWFIDGGQRLGRSFSAFETRWFRPDYSGFGMVPFEHSQGEIEDLLRDVCLTVTAPWVPEPRKNIIRVELPARARALYRDMENTFYAQLSAETEIEAFSAAAKSQKLLQFAAGAVYIDDKGAWKEVHDVKISALESVVEEAAGAPVLVAYHFKSDLARLRKAFPKARVFDASPNTLREWNAGSIPILLAQPASAGHGLNLQDGGHILVFFSLDWSLENHEQIIERIGPMRQKQAGHDRAVFVHYIMAADTIDEVVYERLASKRAVQDLLLEAMKRRV